MKLCLNWEQQRATEDIKSITASSFRETERNFLLFIHLGAYDDDDDDVESQFRTAADPNVLSFSSGFFFFFFFFRI